MSNIKETRVRIKSIKNTAKTTKAMQMVSAAKMRRAQESAQGGKPYSEMINAILANLNQKTDPKLSPLLQDNGVEKNLVIVISSDRGMAGALISNVVKKISEFPAQTQFITVGIKARSFLANTQREVIADFPLPLTSTLATAKEVSDLAIGKFLSGEIGKVSVIYTEFLSTLRQETINKQLLPIENLIGVVNTQVEKESEDYKFEPQAKIILDELLPHFIFAQLSHFLLESRASEHSARMLAMKNATDNALELVDDLTLTYNRLRQETITKEILDISTAAIALE